MVDFNKINRKILAIGRKIKRHFYLHDDVDVLIEELYAVHRQLAELYVLNEVLENDLVEMDKAMADFAFDMLCNMQVPMVLALRSEKSKRYDRVKQWYDRGYWDINMVEMAVQAGWITDEEFNEIVGE